MLSLIVSGAMAQSLTVANITTEAGQEATITVAIEGAAEMTALQFNLSLPEGFALAGDIALGSAASGHTLSISPLASGDQLVVLYSLQQAAFADGTLVIIPVIAAEDAVSGKARLYTVRTATATAVSHTLGNVAFAMNVAAVEPEPEPTPEPEGLSTSKYYRVKNVMTGLYLQVEGNNTNMKLQNKAEGLAMMQIFGLEDAEEGKYYIKAADADNRYYAHASGWNFNATTNADNKTPFTIALVEGEEDVYTLHQSVSSNTGLAGADDSEAGSPIYCDKNESQNGKWAFEALTDEEQAAYVAALNPITYLDELSNNKLYHVSQPNHTKGHQAWGVQQEGTSLKSIHDLGIARNCWDPRQQFAFLTNNEGGTYYLYHVAEAKFVNKDGSLSATPTDVVCFTEGAYDNTFVMFFDNEHYINVGGDNQMVINGWSTPDGGNSCRIVPVADFDATEALKLIETLETGVESSVLDAQGSQLIYDLTGRRVESPTKGIYIVGGKKIVIK